jgi:hypothetical protein
LRLHEPRDAKFAEGIEPSLGAHWLQCVAGLR